MKNKRLASDHFHGRPALDVMIGDFFFGGGSVEAVCGAVVKSNRTRLEGRVLGEPHVCGARDGDGASRSA